jgi:hypothetical protein
VDTRHLGRSQHPVDLSHFGDSLEESTRAQHPNSRDCELREVRKGSQPSPLSLGFTKRECQRFNPSTHEGHAKLREVLVVSPSRWSLVEALARRGYTRIVISGIGRLEKKSRGSSTHELANCELRKALVPRPVVVA